MLKAPDMEPAVSNLRSKAMSAPDEQADPFGAMPELPAATERRWTVRRKAAVIEGVRGGWVPIEEACRLYGISVDEFLSDHLHLNLTHGMSTEGERIFQKE